MANYCRMIEFWVAVQLLIYGVFSRTPVNPLPRYRDVVTTQGTARGYYSPQPPHYAFLGLPYARPPTRFARFKAPEPPAPWTGIFEATHRVKCPQQDGTGEENCLVVNVFTPEHAISLSVIVHVHDGGFQKGWGSYNGFERVLKQDVVFVTFNYRLGAFGFLCLGVEEVPGNSGLKDQVAALYWVNRNIAEFGGDPTDVTVYGTGSGAVSIEMLLFSGLTDNFFRKVVLESGTSMSPKSISYKPIINAAHLAIDLGFTGEPQPAYLMEFFYIQPYKKIANTSKIFLPCIENETISHSLLNKDPRNYLLNDKYQHIPMMIIYTNAEEISIIKDNIETFNTVPQNFENLLPNNLLFHDERTKRTIANLVKKYYFEELELTPSIVKSYVDYINDVFVEYPTVKTAIHYATKQNSVFLMKFLYEGQLSGRNRNIPGASYRDPFKYISSNEYLEDFDEIIAKRLINLLTNFIKLGDPTPLTTQLIPVVWQPVVSHVMDDKRDLQYTPCLQFGKIMKNGLVSGYKFNLWDHIYEKFYIN